MGWLRRWWMDLVVLIIFICLSIAMTWPLVPRLNSHFAGQDIDVWLNPWVTWWTEKVIFEGQSLYDTNMLFYPHGVSLAFHSFSHVNTALELLLRPWLGDLGAYNSTMLLAHALSGFAMYLLVRYLTRSYLGAFFAGLVFAFFPYRMAESVHPHLVSTQWMPLYFLFLLRLVDERRKRYVIPAALFFVLTALSGWHLMVFAILLSVVYLCYLGVVERWRLSKTTALNLVLLAGFISMTLAPFLYPLAREQLTTVRSYAGVPLETGRGNNLVSFFLPAEEHPVFGELVEPVHKRIETKRSAYLGVTVIGLSVVAGLLDWKRARFWILLALFSVLFSIGPYIEVGGHSFDILVPWSRPIVGLIRHPFRANVLVGFAFAVTSGLGLSALLRRIDANRSRMRWSFAGAMMAILVFEYLYLPFPTTAAVVPEYYHDIATSSGEGAVLELPMGRHRSKFYMYYQTVHNRPLLEGHVSRTPEEAYAFIETTPALRSMQACGDWVLPPADLSPLLNALGEQGIGYVILHKDLATSSSVDLWLAVRTASPDYENEHLAVYSTQTDALPSTGAPQLLEGCVGIRPLLPNPTSVLQGEILEIPLEWIAGNTPQQDYVLELTLTDEADEVDLEYRYRVVPGASIMSWPMTSRQTISYSLPVSLAIPPGLYRLQAALVPKEGKPEEILSANLQDIRVLERPKSTTPPAVNATYGTDLRLHGYSLETGTNVVHILLTWQSLRPMEVDYKFFVHLYDMESGALLAQADVMPHNWAYPTTWWEVGEVVADRIPLSLEDIPPGTYTLGIGVYNPFTGERLPITDQPLYLLIDEGRLILPEKVVR